MAGHQHFDDASASGWLVPALPAQLLTAVLVAALVLYLAGTVRARNRSGWPPLRTLSWAAGTAAAAAAVTGPLASAAHHDFRAHAAAHLLIGMAAPLLLVLAAPATLALRALPVAAARRLVRLLDSPPVRFCSNPVTAGVLNLGGLCLLYGTPLLPVMHANSAVAALVHVHFLLAGFLFTAAIVGSDPNRHRKSFACRAAVLVLFMAGHAIVAKYLYGHPPEGVAAAEAEAGSVLMYYGGDAVDLVLVILLCGQWYRAARPRPAAPAPLPGAPAPLPGAARPARAAPERPGGRA